VQQRDLFKAMLEEADITIAARGPSEPVLEGVQGVSPIPSLISGPQRAQITELQRKLNELEEERNRSRDRMTRLEEAERLSNYRLEKIQGENITLRVETSQSTSDARFQKERSERVEEAMNGLQAEMSSVSQRRLDMERMLVEQQKEARAKDENLLQSFEALRTAKDAARRAGERDL
jgi:predicted nuclease with TOPRIM domain